MQHSLRSTAQSLYVMLGVSESAQHGSCERVSSCPVVYAEGVSGLGWFGWTMAPTVAIDRPRRTNPTPTPNHFKDH
jgi:hypothetical protein